MSSGRPSVLSACCGVAELVHDGRTGLVFPPGNYRVLSELLQRLIGSRPMREQMGARARRAVHPRLSWAAVANDLAPLYDARVMRTAS
jgi:phosphatidylinositol alpha 1,6-mannosyltransferase